MKIDNSFGGSFPELSKSNNNILFPLTTETPEIIFRKNMVDPHTHGLYMPPQMAG
jgi:hypothetical protein